MTLDAALVAELLLMGGIAGFLAGLLGVGGGMLQVPFLTWVLGRQGLDPSLVVKVAVATSLATILFTSISSMRAHHRHGAVRWAIVRDMAPGIVAGGLAGAALARWLPSAVMALAFAAVVGLAATRMWRPARPPVPGRELPTGLGLTGAGFGVGGVSALVGAGGAFMSVPYMVRGHVPMHHAVATSSALGFPIALAGTVGYVLAGWNLPGLLPLQAGFVDLPALGCIVCASVCTAPLGARLAHRMDVASLRRAFAVLLYVLAASMAWKGLVG
jgi:uncharacterized protein